MMFAERLAKAQTWRHHLLTHILHFKGAPRLQWTAMSLSMAWSRVPTADAETSQGTRTRGLRLLCWPHVALVGNGLPYASPTARQRRDSADPQPGVGPDVRSHPRSAADAQPNNGTHKIFVACQPQGLRELPQKWIIISRRPAQPFDFWREIHRLEAEIFEFREKIGPGIVEGQGTRMHS